MKRKVKLFSAIASLCLAVALMAFGVYAATTVTYKVESTVTFTSHRHVLFIATESGGKVPASLNSDEVNKATSNKFEFGGNLEGEKTAESKTWSPNREFDVVDGEVSDITYTIAMQNLGADAVKVTVSSTDFFDDRNNITVKVSSKIDNTKVSGEEHNIDVSFVSSYSGSFTEATSEDVNFKSSDTDEDGPVKAISTLSQTSVAQYEVLIVKIVVHVSDPTKTLTDNFDLTFTVEAAGAGA